MLAFGQATALTVVSQVLILLLGTGTSVLLARLLGPEGKGIYALALLFPTLVARLINLGIHQATVYYAAQGRHSLKDILGTNVAFATGFGMLGILVGLVVVLLFRESAFPGVAQSYLLIGLAMIPLNLLFNYSIGLLLGARRFGLTNLTEICRALMNLVLIGVVLWGLGKGVYGALIATAMSWFVVDALLLFGARKVVGGISFGFPSGYAKKALLFGIQAHLGSILMFLNFRLDFFLINTFLEPTALGLYSISVAVAEQLSLVSLAAYRVLLPTVATDEVERKRAELTPLVARIVGGLTALAAILVFFFSSLIVKLLFSTSFLPAVQPLQLLLPGIVALSISRVLASDIAGRGRVILNTYVAALAVVVNLTLNVLWIPKYGISGAALASTVSYSFSLVFRILLYRRLSRNPLRVLVPKRMDWQLLLRGCVLLGGRALAKIGKLKGGPTQ